MDSTTPQFPAHAHVLGKPTRFRGEQIGSSHCITCGRGMQHVLCDSLVCIVRPGWAGELLFTSWVQLPISGRA